jgi:serine/threonine protein phosphatase 1
MGIFAIGDVHGCARSLDALLDKLGATADDHLVFVGDYVDRGPSSRQVIERLLRLEEEASRGTAPRCTFLRGNHDQMMLDWVDYGEIELWRPNGAFSTLASYSESGVGLTVPDKHVDFLRRTKLYLDTTDYCFVHAGLNPDISVAENLRFETAQTFLWTRGHFAAARRWEKTVVCGHTPQSEPLIEPDLIDIDTGCCFNHHPRYGKLSAIQLPELVVTQVENQE